MRVMRVDAAKQRWRVERDYQELEQEVRFGHKDADREAVTTTPHCASRLTGFRISEREAISSFSTSLHRAVH